MQHPGKLLQQELTKRGWTQKVFANILGKKVSEVNELIKGKRNITVQRDILLSAVFGDPEQKRLKFQNDFDYVLVKISMEEKLQELTSKSSKISLSSSPKKVVSVPSKPESKPTPQPIPQQPVPPVRQPQIPTQSANIPPKKTKEHEVFEDF